jgi:hypothetical protein
MTASPTPTPTPLTCSSTPQMGCRAAGKSVLRIHSGAGSEKLVWKWLKGVATSQMEFADPTATTDYALCLYDGSGLLAQTVVSAGANITGVNFSGADLGNASFCGGELGPVGGQNFLHTFTASIALFPETGVSR